LRIDFTGLSESDGDFGDSNSSTPIDDILAANKLLQEHYQLPAIFIAHSMGETASYAAANQLSNIKAIISIASLSSPSHVLHHFGDTLKHINSGNDFEFHVAGKSYPIKPQFLSDLKNHDLDTTTHNLKKAVLIFHGENDQLVNIEHAEKIFATAQQPKSFVSLDTADHVLSDKKDASYVAEVIYSWVQRYI